MDQNSTAQSNAKIEKAKKMEKAVLDFQQAVKGDLVEIKEKIDAVRTKVGVCITDEGCLRGHISDYIEAFDAQIDRVNKKLNQERRVWTNQAKAVNVLKQKQESQLRSLLAQHQKEIQSLMTSEAPPDAALQIKQLPMMGKAIKKNQVNFKWPEQKDLTEFDMDAPPKLLKVNSKGVERSELTGI